MRTTFEFRVGYTIGEYINGELVHDPCLYAENGKHEFYFSERNRSLICECCQKRISDVTARRRKYV